MTELREDQVRLTEEQLEAFRRDGVIVAEGILSDADLQPVIDEYAAWVDRRAKALHGEGAIIDLQERAPFDERFGLLYAQSRTIAVGMDIMEMRGPAVFAFLRNPSLLDAVECLVGPEITCNPIQHVRAKPPEQPGSQGFYNVPWHQDMGVTLEEAEDTDIVTCWIPLVDATIENGCMEVLPGVAKRGYLRHHSGEGGTTILPDLLPAEVAPRQVPAPKGSVVFMHRCTPHRSTPNRTRKVRWSIDLRYNETGKPTGRPFHPAFVARSIAAPESELTDHSVWARMWHEALAAAHGQRAHRV